jgi:hypothetical protein
VLVESEPATITQYPWRVLRNSRHISSYLQRVQRNEEVDPTSKMGVLAEVAFECWVTKVHF